MKPPVVSESTLWIRASDVNECTTYLYEVCKEMSEKGLCAEAQLIAMARIIAGSMKSMNPSDAGKEMFLQQMTDVWDRIKGEPDEIVKNPAVESA